MSGTTAAAAHAAFTRCPECRAPFSNLRRAVRVSTNLIQDLQQATISYQTSQFNPDEISVQISCGQSQNAPGVTVYGSCKVDRQARLVYSWAC